MKFSIDPATLKPILKKLAVAIHANPVIPVLNDILVMVNKKEVLLTTTDLGLTITAAIKAETRGKGSFLIPFKQLQSLCALETENLHVELTEDQLVMLTFGDDEAKPVSRFCLGKANNADDFPKLPQIEGEAVELSPDFMDSINVAALSASKDALRASMCCICVELTADQTNIISTDAHTLYHHQIDKGLPTVTEKVELLLPAAIAQAIYGMPAAQISFNQNHVAILSEGLTVVCTRGNDKYPAWRTVMAPHLTNATVNALDLQNALEKALVVADITSRGVDIKPSPFDLEISAEDANTGMNAKCILQAQVGELNATHLRANGRLLMRSLNQIEGLIPKDFQTAKLCLSLQQSTKPITLQIEGRTDITILIMPMNIS